MLDTWTSRVEREGEEDRSPQYVFRSCVNFHVQMSRMNIEI